jgi:hypothetical protein
METFLLVIIDRDTEERTAVRRIRDATIVLASFKLPVFLWMTMTCVMWKVDLLGRLIEYVLASRVASSDSSDEFSHISRPAE